MITQVEFSSVFALRLRGKVRLYLGKIQVTGGARFRMDLQSFKVNFDLGSVISGSKMGDYTI